MKIVDNKKCAMKNEVNRVKEENAGIFYIDSPKDRENIVEGSGFGNLDTTNSKGSDDEDDNKRDDKILTNKNDKSNDDIDFSGHGPNEKDDESDDDEGSGGKYKFRFCVNLEIFWF